MDKLLFSSKIEYTYEDYIKNCERCGLKPENIKSEDDPMYSLHQDMLVFDTFLHAVRETGLEKTPLFVYETTTKTNMDNKKSEKNRVFICPDFHNAICLCWYNKVEPVYEVYQSGNTIKIISDYRNDFDEKFQSTYILYFLKSDNISAYQVDIERDTMKNIPEIIV